MAIKFEFYESPHTIGTDKKHYHARVVNWQRIDTDHLAREIHHSSSLTIADIKATLISLSEKLVYHLKDGARVHLEGIGYFHISLACPETHSPQKTRANKVKFKSVTFRADKYLKKELSATKTERSKYKPHSASLTEEQIDLLLTEYFRTNNVLTRRVLEQLCMMKRATAGRHMARLAKEGKLRNISIPHNPIYEPAPGFYGREKLPEPVSEPEGGTTDGTGSETGHRPTKETIIETI
ncbi:HU family DNA-binding protein [Phocaeicola sp.]|uniref:HU family DNA-binding protein n=1 Tax=Phocaeicola sp. TaxID=2773926 RepID=UPI0023C5B1EA|nr:HU family DNA-binding protein [Phocaeicola sp.]MDE5678720.1 HU family DNA-binding protein [Phocaeicola sp.]